MISVSHIEVDLYHITVAGERPTVHVVRMTQADYRSLSGRRCTHAWI